MRDRSDFRPTAVHYNMAVRAMVAANKIREAHQLLAEAVQVSVACPHEYLFIRGRGVGDCGFGIGVQLCTPGSF